MPYKFIEHTADVQFQATGDTLEEAFKESLNALKETVCGNITILEQETKELKIQGTDLVNLLQKFLEEFLFLLDSEDFLVSQIKNISINQETNELTVTISGDKAENYNFTNDVKAVTYNKMFVKQENSHWITQVVLDV